MTSRRRLLIRSLPLSRGMPLRIRRLIFILRHRTVHHRRRARHKIFDQLLQKLHALRLLLIRHRKRRRSALRQLSERLI